MDDVIRTGSEQACNVLSLFPTLTWYQNTCLRFENSEAYRQAGWYFWIVSVIAAAFFLVAVRKTLRMIFA